MHEDPVNVTLAVLAGGESRRMGTAKANLQLNGKSMLVGLHERLAWKGPTMLVIAPGREKPSGHELFDAVAVDAVAGEGPLRGVLTALEQTVTPWLVVIPVDMPGLTAEKLLMLADSLMQNQGSSLAMFGKAGKGIEPLPAAFAVEPALVIVREQRGALRDLPKVMNTMIVPVSHCDQTSFWVNLNRPEDVEDYLSHAVTQGKP